MLIRATEKSRTKVDGFNASALVQLTFKDGGDACWFQLSSSDEDAAKDIKSPNFKYREVERIRVSLIFPCGLLEVLTKPRRPFLPSTPVKHRNF